jgi:integrase/recombinase XerD
MWFSRHEDAGHLRIVVGRCTYFGSALEIFGSRRTFDTPSAEPRLKAAATLHSADGWREMLEFYFTDGRCLDRLRSGPLARCIDELAGDLQRHGYARHTARLTLGIAAKFSQFAVGRGLTSAARIDDELVECFLKKELPPQGRFRHASTAMHLVLTLLRRRGRIPPARKPPPPDASARLLAKYDRYLRDTRGLVASTRDHYLRSSRRLLVWRLRHSSSRSLRSLSGADVVAFIKDSIRQHPVVNDGNESTFGQQLCSATRIFLRYLRGEGIIDSDLARVVPKIPKWRLASIPRHLPWDDVRKLVDSVDTSRPVGLRDRAILLLIARLGLRASEVRTLELRNINWRSGEIRLARTKNRRERIVPLPQEVGAALAAYVLRARPQVNLPFVFLRKCAPRAPLTAPNAIGGIVARQLRRAKILAPSRPGSHLLRHSLATRMINAGTPIKDIADLLGHASIDTTAIYAKVDVPRLAAVALPFPVES